MEPLNSNTVATDENPQPIDKATLQCPLYLYTGNCHNKKYCVYQHTRRFFRSQLQVKKGQSKLVEYKPESGDNDSKDFAKSFLQAISKGREELKQESLQEEEAKAKANADPYNPFSFSRHRNQLSSRLKTTTKEFTPWQTNPQDSIPDQQEIMNITNAEFDGQVFFDEYIAPEYLMDSNEDNYHENIPSEPTELYYPESGSCSCCHGHVYTCSGVKCKRLGGCECYLEDKYYPENAFCDCCHGHVYSCSGLVCQKLGPCVCFQ